MKVSRLVIDIDEELRYKFRIATLKQGKTMKEVLTEYIQEYIDEHG